MIKGETSWPLLRYEMGECASYTWYNATQDQHCKTVVDLVLPEEIPKHVHLYMLAAGEHCLLFIMFLLYYSDPTSLQVHKEQYRQQFFDNRVAVEVQDEHILQPRLRQRQRPPRGAVKSDDPQPR